MSPAPDLTRRPRTRIAFTDADMVRLRDLYYDTAIPMVKIAQAFGVSASTLFHWIADMDWPRRSASAPRIDARVDFFARVEADPPKRFAVYEDLEKSVEALARSMKPPKDAARKRPERQYRLYGAGGKPEGGW